LSEDGKGEFAQILVVLPYHLRNLAKIEGDALIDVVPPVTLRRVLDAIEARYPMLRGTIREYETGKRRAFLRFFACAEDISLVAPDTELPEAVAAGKEPLMIIGAVAGGATGNKNIGDRRTQIRD
jgi:sulfur-carrier protein